MKSTGNKLIPVGTGVSVAQAIDNGPIALVCGSYVQKVFSDRVITHVAIGNISGFNMVTCILKSKKSKNPMALRNGYQLCYSYNLDAPSLSEGGDCIIEKRGEDYYRVG